MTVEKRSPRKPASKTSPSGGKAEPRKFKPKSRKPAPKTTGPKPETDNLPFGKFRKPVPPPKAKGGKRDDSDFPKVRKRRFDDTASDVPRGRSRRSESGKGIRLNKYIANAGVCSRREADKLIESGVVTINGNIVSELGTRVLPTDVVNYGGQKLSHEALRYVLLNKPKDYITTTDDPENRKTVMLLIKNACRERVYPVGRLDRHTTGLLLFTNDGELTKKLMHPSHRFKKLYHVSLDKNVTSEDLRKISAGLVLDDGPAPVDGVAYVGDRKDEIGIELHIGKNRIVRRIFEHLGYKVVKLDRVMLGPLTKKDLPRGRYRILTEKEVSYLKML